MHDEVEAFYATLSEHKKELFLVLVAFELTQAMRAVYLDHRSEDYCRLINEIQHRLLSHVSESMLDWTPRRPDLGRFDILRPA